MSRFFLAGYIFHNDKTKERELTEIRWNFTTKLELIKKKLK